MLTSNHLIRHDGHAVIFMNGRFDFATRTQAMHAFKQAMQETRGDIHVDLGQVDYLDSSALGILLVMRDEAKKTGRQILLENPQGLVADVLKIANFNKLFPISRSL